MFTVRPAEGPILEHILNSTYPTSHQGLSQRAFAQLDDAQSKTAWALGHRRRFALTDGADVLASALRHDLNGTLDAQRVSICGIGEVHTDTARHSVSHARALVERLLDDARRDGADVALLCVPTEWMTGLSGFDVIPTTDVELKVTESTRHGAPMTLVRGGEDRDLPAIVAMGQTRAASFRFHLDRDADLVRHGMTRKRLLAGLGPAGGRQFEFVIAEEGITAAAYVVMSIADRTWTIEECGDRDPSGARVGAILQALIAREPVERRPVIRGWLPPGFVPPQASILSSAAPSTHIFLGKTLGQPPKPLHLAPEEVMYWRADLF